MKLQNYQKLTDHNYHFILIFRHARLLATAIENRDGSVDARGETISAFLPFPLLFTIKYFSDENVAGGKNLSHFGLPAIDAGCC